MHSRRLHFVLAILLFAAFAFAAEAQKPAEVWAEWETLSPANEEFTVLMPKNLTTDAMIFPYHNMELNARLYMAKSSSGPVIAITSFSGIKSNPAQYTEFARFNSYIDAFKTFFPPKVRSKETLAKMTLVSSVPFHGYTGRFYKLTIGDLNGSVNAFVTRKRFYAIVSLNNKKDEALEEKFLSSFVLPDLQPEPPKNVAAVNPDEQQNPPAPPQDPNTHPQTQGQQGQKKAPINGGMLNPKAIYLPPAELPPGAGNGVVLVAILVDEQGSVIEARAVSGPQPLQAAAVNAARLARFSPTLLMGEPVKVSGTLSYNFSRSN